MKLIDMEDYELYCIGRGYMKLRLQGEEIRITLIDDGNEEYVYISREQAVDFANALLKVASSGE